MEIKKIEDDAHKEATARAKTIVATAIQRFASEFVHERTVATIPLPSDDLKGRLIGREDNRLQLLPHGAGTRQQVITDPPWIAVAAKLVRAL